MNQDKNIAVYTTSDDNYIIPSIIAIESYRLFHPNLDYFVIGNKKIIREEKIELMNKFNIEFIHSDYNENFLYNNWPNTAYLLFKGPELLFERGYKYSLSIDADTFCVYPLDFDYLSENTKGYSGIYNDYPMLYNFSKPAEIQKYFNLSDELINYGNTNSGVVFWNNEYASNSKIAEKAVEKYKILIENIDSSLNGDQALLALLTVTENIPFHIIDFGYNYRLSKVINFDKTKKIRIYHFTERKPWKSNFKIYLNSLLAYFIFYNDNLSNEAYNPSKKFSLKVFIRDTFIFSKWYFIELKYKKFARKILKDFC